MTETTEPRDVRTAGLEVLTRPGCVATPLMHARLQAAVTRLDIPLSCALVDITALAPDDERRRYPTPTVLLRSADLFGMKVPATCTAPT